MKINLSYSKLIKIEGYASDLVVEVEDNCTVRGLLTFLKLPTYLQKAVIVHVNEEPVWNATVLKENDSVKLYRLVSGG
ncbi:MAG: MoaD/ThiS family protein [Chloroflexi bacterium]|nr:MoaD/ThiS family protein [Chloroflexota bacterium]